MMQSREKERSEKRRENDGLTQMITIEEKKRARSQLERGEARSLYILAPLFESTDRSHLLLAGRGIGEEKKRCEEDRRGSEAKQQLELQNL